MPERYGRGSWVIVTSCTKNIGLEMCHELARLGFNIVMIGRSPTDLNSAIQQVKQRSKTEVIAIEFNFA